MRTHTIVAILTVATLSLIVAAPSAAAEPTASLAGVHSVYINVGDPSIKREIARALRAELPQVKIVALSEADAVLEFRGSGASDEAPDASNSVYAPDLSFQDTTIVSYDVANQTHTVLVPLGHSTHPAAHVQGIYVIRSKQAAVVHQGLWTPAFPTQFAARFITAWREANP